MLDKAKVEELERLLDVARGNVSPFGGPFQADEARQKILNALPALLRLARAVVEAPRVEALQAEMIALAGGNHWHAKVGLWGETAKSLGGQTVLLLRADAAGNGEGVG